MTEAAQPVPPAAPAVNPKVAAANEMLKKKMATATLVSKEVFAGGRLGVFKLKPDTTDRWWYQAGQYTTLGLDTPTGFVPRAYSIAGSPLDDGIIEFYIALVEGGALTPTIFAQEPGATFRYLSPKGKFTLATAGKKTLVMVATGTGLAPFVAQIRSLWKLHQAGVPSAYRIILFHGAAYSDEFGYAAELEGYAAARTQGFDFTYLKTSSRPDAARGWVPAIAKGRVNEVVRTVLGQPIPAGRSVEMPPGVTAESIRELIVPADTAFMACGNPGMIEDLKEPIAHLGVSTYLVEEFWKA
jgi:ferredoxin-NADP reductase